MKRLIWEKKSRKNAKNVYASRRKKNTQTLIVLKNFWNLSFFLHINEKFYTGFLVPKKKIENKVRTCCIQNYFQLCISQRLSFLVFCNFHSREQRFLQMSRVKSRLKLLGNVRKCRYFSLCTEFQNCLPLICEFKIKSF